MLSSTGLEPKKRNPNGKSNSYRGIDKMDRRDCDVGSPNQLSLFPVLNLVWDSVAPDLGIGRVATTSPSKVEDTRSPTTWACAAGLC